MNILLAIPVTIPVRKYGGAQRILWWLGKELHTMGHKVTFLVNPGSSSPYGKVIPYHKEDPLNNQIPPETDLVHFLSEFREDPGKPHLTTIQGNTSLERKFHVNTVFISRNHADRHHATAFVHNGIDPSDYGIPDLHNPREYLHFLGKAAWRLKNVRGAIRVARSSGNPLAVIGGRRLNIKMGFRFTTDPRIRFFGMLGGSRKNKVINGSKGLLFPVLWHEPFGLAIIESLYFGCPVFGTPYGSLPELVPPEMGHLSASISSLAEAVGNCDGYDRLQCHEYVMDRFTSKRMALEYLGLYEKVLAGDALNPANPYTDAEDAVRFLPFTE